MRRIAQMTVGVTALMLVAFVGVPLASAGGDPVGGSGGASRVDAAGPHVVSLVKVKISFNAVPSAGNPILTHLATKGFAFDGAHFHTIDSPGLCSFGGCVSNGTIYIAEEEGGLGQPFAMTNVTGGTFKLKKVNLGQLWTDDAAASAGGFPNATLVTLTGRLSGGGVVITSFVPPATGFATFTLPTAFKGLISVTFSANGAFAGDDIKVVS